MRYFYTSPDILRQDTGIKTYNQQKSWANNRAVKSVLIAWVSERKLLSTAY